MCNVNYINILMGYSLMEERGNGNQVVEIDKTAILCFLRYLKQGQETRIVDKKTN